MRSHSTASQFLGWSLLNIRLIPMNPLAAAVRGKGGLGCVRRASKIARQYGNSGARMAAALAQFARLLGEFGCSATFPITSVVLARHPGLIRYYQRQGIEFAVHGYRHTDFSMMSLKTQIDQLCRAREVFDRCGIPAHGFRSPYLRHTHETRAALNRCGFMYDASQALAWNCLPCQPAPGYIRALSFYHAISSEDSLSLPQLENGIVRIPYCLPDDESVIDRLGFTAEQIAEAWLTVLERTMETGELFCLGIHPERIGPCAEPVRRVLSVARQNATVWIARLDEIATWWKARSQAQVRISSPEKRKFRVQVEGPPGTVVLLRGVEADDRTDPAFGAYRKSPSLDFSVTCAVRPFIRFDRRTGADVVNFLREQGYVLQTGDGPGFYSHYVDLPELGHSGRRLLLDQLENSERPLIRLARWPRGYRSALAVTGDIDALTCWDYGLRLLGR